MTERVEPELGWFWFFFPWFWSWFKFWFKGSNLGSEAEVARLLRLADTLKVIIVQRDSARIGNLFEI